MTPTDNSDRTLGEISRSVDRVEQALKELAQSVHASLGSVAINATEIARITEEQRDLKDKVDVIQVRSAFISGGIAVLGVLGDFLFGRHS